VTDADVAVDCLVCLLCTVRTGRALACNVALVANSAVIKAKNVRTMESPKLD
jgi:hypothetical protein